MSWKVGFDRKTHCTLSPNVEKLGNRLNVMTVRNTGGGSKKKKQKQSQASKDNIIKEESVACERPSTNSNVKDMNVTTKIEWTDHAMYEFLSSHPTRLPQLLTISEINLSSSKMPMYVCHFLNDMEEECIATVSGLLLRLHYREDALKHQTHLVKRLVS